MSHQSPEQRVLRIGIVHGGQVIREALVPPGETPTLGTSPRCTITLPQLDGIPEQLALFYCRRGRYTLRLPAGAALKLARNGTVQDLALGDARLPLEDTDRGRITLGELTLLFQLVEPPPMPARLLKSSFRPRLLDEDDPTFLGILSLCSAAAAVLMVYVSVQPTPELMTVGELPDYFATVQLTAPPPPESTEPAPELLVQESDAARPVPAPEPEPVAETPRPRPQDDPALSPGERERQRALALQARQREVTSQSALLRGLDNLIRTPGESGSGVFQDYDSLSEQIAAATAGISTGGPLASASPGGSLRGAVGGTGRGDARLGGIEGGFGGGDGSGQAEVVRAPTPTVRQSPAVKPGSVTTTAAPTQKEAIKKGVRGAQVRACYEQRLKEIPNLSGRLVLDFSVFDGRVEDVRFSENTTGDRELESCVARAVRNWTFVGVEEAEVSQPYALTPGE